MNKGKKVVEFDAQSVFQFKITLNDSSPRVWRRFQVSAAYSFFDLHVAIQDVMGWTDTHLHAFYIAQKGTAAPIVIEFPHPEFDEPSLEREVRDERTQKIADYFGVLVKQCMYTYDFGDSWDHTVLFERALKPLSGVSYPQFIAGKNACPPEDSRGVYGYRDLQKILKNPKHPDNADMLEWLGLDEPEDFLPADFNPAEVTFLDPRKRLKEYNKGFKV